MEDVKKLTDDQIEWYMEAIDAEYHKRRAEREAMARSVAIDRRRKYYEVDQSAVFFAKSSDSFTDTFHTPYRSLDWRQDAKNIRCGKSHLSVEMEDEHKLVLTYDKSHDTVTVDIRNTDWSSLEIDMDRKLFIAIIELFKEEFGEKFKNI